MFTMCHLCWWIRQGGHLFFPISQKNTNLIEDVEILLPAKFRWNLFSGFREVENVLANKRPGRPSCFSDQDVEILHPVKFVELRSAVRGEVENASANQFFCLSLCFFVSICGKNFNLGDNFWTVRSQRPLPSLCFSGISEKQDGRPGLWFADTFSTSPLKPLNRFKRNLAGSKISQANS